MAHHHAFAFDVRNGLKKRRTYFPFPSLLHNQHTPIRHRIKGAPFQPGVQQKSSPDEILPDHYKRDSPNRHEQGRRSPAWTISPISENTRLPEDRKPSP